jgi:hypothetical protein
MADVSDLTAIFGDPFKPLEPDKTTMEWALLFVDEETGESVPATIYDWKRTPGFSVGGYATAPWNWCSNLSGGCDGRKI